jgi:hypothetical protein
VSAVISKFRELKFENSKSHSLTLIFAVLSDPEEVSSISCLLIHTKRKNKETFHTQKINEELLLINFPRRKRGK